MLNYLVNRNLGRKKGRQVGKADFKAVFPSVNIGILWRALRERRGRTDDN